MRRHLPSEHGFTLTELLVTLVITLILATAIFAFYLSSTRVVSNQNSTVDMWQRGRNALAIVTQAVESAGFGLPSLSDCPNGVADFSTSSQTNPYLLTAVTASSQAGPGYNPSAQTGINTYTLITVSGSSSLGNAPATQINSLPSLNSSSVSVNDATLLDPGDMIVVQLTDGSGTCLLGQITNVSGKGTITTPGCTIPTGNGNVGNTIVVNSGQSTCYQFNPNQIFAKYSSLSSTSISSFTNANIYDLGNQNFQVDQFQILDTPPGSNSVGVPTLYMTQYTARQGTPPAVHTLARGIVDLQVQYGLGSNGAITSWVFPENYTPSQSQRILAVRIAMLARNTLYLPNQTSPATFDLLGRTYKVPASNGPGCTNGDCRHYAYHLFQTVIPVRNHIWGGGQ